MLGGLTYHYAYTSLCCQRVYIFALYNFREQSYIGGWALSAIAPKDLNRFGSYRSSLEFQAVRLFH